MPVTKTAKRALRASKRKALVNKSIIKDLEIAIRSAKRSKSLQAVKKAVSLADRAAKAKTIHKNKAGRIKSSLSKLLGKVKASSKAKLPSKKTAKRASKKTSKK